MSEETRPWERVLAIVELGDAAELEAYLDNLPRSEAGRVISRLDEAEQNRVLTMITAETAAELIDEIADVQAADLLEQLPAETAAAIVTALPSNEQADLMHEVNPLAADTILSAMPAEAAASVRTLAGYEDDVAGGLMITEFLAFRADWTVAEVIENMRRRAEEYADYDVQYSYVVKPGGELVGVLRLRDLLLAPGSRKLESLMVPDPQCLRDDAPYEEVIEFFDRHGFLGVPIVDADKRLKGVVRRLEVQEAIAEHHRDDYLKSQGIMGGEELRTMPLLRRSTRRLSWLSINIVLNLIAASIIAFYQDTLAAVITLAVFLPIISDMSGCSGNQAVAVSMRELSLGLVRPFEVMRVWMKEASVGVLNGIVLGLLIGTIAMVWKGNPWLGAVVGAALAINTVVAVSIGGTVPLLLKRLKFDPALASGPILTTITDMCGFFTILSLATMLLDKLR